MAGKRQHHVWQMLQKGFSWQENGDHHVWVYKNGLVPKQTVTRKFGQINSFYGEVGSAADENITEFENATQGFIHRTRRLDDGQEIDRETAATLVSHLEMRSLFLREEMSRLSERMMRALRDCMTSPTKYKAIMSAYMKNHPELLDAEIEKAERSVSMRPVLRDLMLQQAPAVIKNSVSEVAVIAEKMYARFADSMEDIAKNAHNRALLTDFSEAKRTEFHRSLRFSVMRTTGAEFILPDTSLAFFTQDGCTPASQKGDKVEAVIIPLSVEVAIIGRRDPLFQRDMQTIQRALASCSYEAFLSPRRSTNLEKLSRRISKNAKLMTEAEISSMIPMDQLLKL